MPEVGQVMACVGVAQASALRLKDGVEAGDEHVERDTSQQRLVDLLEYLTGGGGAQGSSGELEHAAGCGHHQRCRHALARSVPHNHSQPTLRKEVEVVEVAPHFPGGPVVWKDLPTLHFGHLLGQRGLLDAPRYPELLLDA